MNDSIGGFLAHPWHLTHSGVSELTPQDWHISDLELITFLAEAEVTAQLELSGHSPTLASVDGL